MACSRPETAKPGALRHQFTNPMSQDEHTLVTNFNPSLKSYVSHLLPKISWKVIREHDKNIYTKELTAAYSKSFQKNVKCFHFPKPLSAVFLLDK